jgi:hypothetical protein
MYFSSFLIVLLTFNLTFYTLPQLLEASSLLILFNLIFLSGDFFQSLI